MYTNLLLEKKRVVKPEAWCSEFEPAAQDIILGVFYCTVY